MAPLLRDLGLGSLSHGDSQRELSERRDQRENVVLLHVLLSSLGLGEAGLDLLPLGEVVKLVMMTLLLSLVALHLLLQPGLGQVGGKVSLFLLLLSLKPGLSFLAPKL